jgi:hypothetical protein
MVASGMASEVLINEIQKRLKKPIGSSPSFIRGVVGSSFEMSEYENSKFETCLACSMGVAEEYLKDRKDFLFKVIYFMFFIFNYETLNDSKFLQKFTNLDEDDEDIDDIEEIDAQIIALTDDDFAEV